MTTALITGASRGIGRAIALRLAADGHEIIAAARNGEELESLCTEIHNAGGRCLALVLDISDAGAVARTVSGLDVEILINNAGVGMLKPFLETTPDEWHRTIDVNVNALYHLTRAVLPGMIARGHGHICTIGSIAGRNAFVGGSCYAATKAFVTSWAESLMLEVREHGVKVSVVMPGSVTSHFNSHEPSPDDSWKLSPSDVADTVAHLIATPANVLVHRAEVRTLTVPAGRTRR